MGRDGRYLGHFRAGFAPAAMAERAEAPRCERACVLTRGLVLAAPHLGQRQDHVALGAPAARCGAAGMRVAAAKAGPDYIDAAFLAAASGCDCRNLDAWAMRRATSPPISGTRRAPISSCAKARWVCSTASAPAAKARPPRWRASLGWPVVLVVDAAGMGASVAALVEGFARHRPDTSLAGVILNRVGSARHRDLLGAALAAELPEVPLLGALPRDARAGAARRAISGWCRRASTASLEAFLDRRRGLRRKPSRCRRASRALARPASLAIGRARAAPAAARPAHRRRARPCLRLRLSRDARGLARSRRHAVVLLAARRRGPGWRADAVFLPGGYPELHAARLAAAALPRRPRAAAARGAVIYGECGGYMVLGAGLVDAHGARHGMAGLLPLETSFAERRLHLGYRAARLWRRWSARGRRARAFAATSSTTPRSRRGRWRRRCSRSRMAPARRCRQPAASIGTVMGSFVHLIDRT